MSRSHVTIGLETRGRILIVRKWASGDKYNHTMVINYFTLFLSISVYETVD